MTVLEFNEAPESLETKEKYDILSPPLTFFIYINSETGKVASTQHPAAMDTKPDFGKFPKRP